LFSEKLQEIYYRSSDKKEKLWGGRFNTILTNWENAKSSYIELLQSNQKDKYKEQFVQFKQKNISKLQDTFGELAFEPLLDDEIDKRFISLQKTKAYYDEYKYLLRTKQSYNYDSDAGQAANYTIWLPSFSPTYYVGNIIAWWEGRGVLNPQIDAYWSGDKYILNDIYNIIVSILNCLLSLFITTSKLDTKNDGEYLHALKLLKSGETDKLNIFLTENPNANYSYDNSNQHIEDLAKDKNIDVWNPSRSFRT